MFCDRLIQLRKSKNLTQQELANKLNVSLSSIGNWESGDRTPPLDKMIFIAKFFNVSLDYLTNSEVEVNGNSNIVINQNQSHNPVATVTVKNGETKTRELSEIELELLKVCERFDVKEKTHILNTAYELEKNKREDLR
jgi:transcriptional regulator with XRE-family HTH domain